MLFCWIVSLSDTEMIGYINEKLEDRKQKTKNKKS